MVPGVKARTLTATEHYVRLLHMLSDYITYDMQIFENLKREECSSVQLVPGVSTQHKPYRTVQALPVNDAASSGTRMDLRSRFFKKCVLAFIVAVGRFACKYTCICLLVIKSIHQSGPGRLSLSMHLLFK